MTQVSSLSHRSDPSSQLQLLLWCFAKFAFSYKPFTRLTICVYSPQSGWCLDVPSWTFMGIHWFHVRVMQNQEGVRHATTGQDSSGFPPFSAENLFDGDALDAHLSNQYLTVPIIACQHETGKSQAKSHRHVSTFLVLPNSSRKLHSAE